MVNKRKILIEAISNRLIPFLKEQGFVKCNVANEKLWNKGMKIPFPFGLLQRDSDSGVELLEIQFDRSGGGRFIINFGVMPFQGVTLPWGHFTLENITVSALPESYRLYQTPIFYKWFSIGLFTRDVQLGAEKTVEKVITLFPEIEAWFRERVIGRHIR